MHVCACVLDAVNLDGAVDIVTTSQASILCFYSSGTVPPSFTRHTIRGPKGSTNEADVKIADLDGNSIPDVASALGPIVTAHLNPSCPAGRYGVSG